MTVQSLLKQIPRLRARGIDILRDPRLNKGTAFTLKERQLLGIHGLLPPGSLNEEKQVVRAINNMYQLDDDGSRYDYLMSLHDRNEKLFYKTIAENLEYCLPLIYTPTIASVCLDSSLYFKRPHGLYITINDRDHVLSLLGNWPEKRVKAVVMTDGEKLLGLGDRGVSAMDVAVGKTTLNTVLAGIQPRHNLPICLDVGTNNENLLNSRFYPGLKKKRTTGEEYFTFVDQVMEALKTRYGPHVCIQFEDFGKENAFEFKSRYEQDYVTFNDDISGSGAVTLAGLINSARASGIELKDHKILFYGAGQSAIGAAELIEKYLAEQGLSSEEVRKNIYMMDSKGLIVDSRPEGLPSTPAKKYAKNNISPLQNLDEVIRAIRPSVLIGSSSKAGAFSREILRDFGSMNKKPIIFSLSNPNEKAECSAELAYKTTDCRCIFVGGSPFDPIRTPDGREYFPSQGNNMYSFPGVTLALSLVGIQPVSDDIFLTVAKTIAGMVTDEELKRGSMFPSVKKLPDVAMNVALALIKQSYQNHTAAYHPEPKNKEVFLKSKKYSIDYFNLIPDNYKWEKY